MKTLLVKEGDAVLLAITGATEAEGHNHIKNGYQHLLPILDRLTFVEVDGAPESFNSVDPYEEQAKATEQLEATNADMAQVGEYLVDVLVAKGVLTESELPPSAQATLALRRELHSKIPKG